MAASWLTSPAGRRLAGALALVVAGQLVVSIYEVMGLGLPLVREEPASFETFRLALSAYALLAGGLLVTAIISSRAAGSALDRQDLAPADRLAAKTVMGAALAATLLFVFDPAAFHAQAQEDHPLEWISALLLFAGAGLFAADFLRNLASSTRRSAGAAMALAGGLALVILVVGMEEISWGQRVFGFGTPDALAEVNWQAEFNFHNVQTDLSETLYYVGSAVFLILLPLLRDMVPAAAASHRLFAYIPGRSTAAVAAPIAIFNYGHWNLLPIQLSVTASLFAMLAFAWAAKARANPAEQRLFLGLAAAIAVGQGLFLLYGPAIRDLPDATEYKEFFIALGFAWFAWRAWRNEAKRS